MTEPRSTWLRYTDDVEQLHPDEDRLIAETVAAMGRVARARNEAGRHGVRDVHAKSHGLLRGELRVHDDLPPHLAQGLFATPATYPVIIRLSTTPGTVTDDRDTQPRGMAIKVLGVPGERAVDDGASTQDLVLVNAPIIPFGDIAAYHDRQIADERNPPSAFRLRLVALGARLARWGLRLIHRPVPPILDILGQPNTNPLGETYHSMAALRYGDHVAKLSVAPASPSVRALTGVPIPDDAGDSVLRDLVVAHFAGDSATYELRAQLCADLATMPVEDASVPWPESESPHQPVATIEIGPQDAYSDERRAYVDDVLSFTPWHALAAHRPLGSIMRVRRAAYQQSSDLRHEYNAVAAVEPRTIDDLPD